jgi:hypothetical protein
MVSYYRDAPTSLCHRSRELMESAELSPGVELVLGSIADRAGY